MLGNVRFVHLFRKAVPSLKKSLGMSVRSWRASAISRRKRECERWSDLEGAVRLSEVACSESQASGGTRGCDRVSCECEGASCDNCVLMMLIVIAQVD